MVEPRVAHRWCILKHVLLSARTVEELYERLRAYEEDEKVDAIEPAMRALLAAATELFKDTFGVSDEYSAYHLMHALMDLLAAEIHAAEALPEALPVIRRLRDALLDAVMRYEQGGSGENRGDASGAGGEQR